LLIYGRNQLDVKSYQGTKKLNVGSLNFDNPDYHRGSISISL
jgi:hypothetical protein